MAEERCPNCGAELPRELGQHALTPSAGLVQCPSCGETVTLQKPGAPEPEDEARAGADVARAEAAPPGQRGPEEFSGEETVEGVMDEVREKEDE